MTNKHKTQASELFEILIDPDTAPAPNLAFASTLYLISSSSH
jgi:hypothetical protein